MPKKGNAKECSNCRTIALISHTSKVMLKILQARLQQYMNCKLPDVQVGFRKGRGARDQIANIRWIIQKAREFQKNINDVTFTFIKKLFSSSSLSAIRVVSSAYLKLLIFLLAILIPAYASSSPVFLMMYSAYKLNKQGDNMQP